MISKRSLGTLLITLSILLAQIITYAGEPVKCTISGVVTDSINAEGLPYASIQLKSIDEELHSYGVMTDAEGVYVIKDIKPGNYLIQVSYMGFQTKKLEITLINKNTKLDFELQRVALSLDGVSISAEKELVERSIEKVTVNVAKDITLSGGSATDVFQSLPAVDVDVNGEINYRGSDKVVILIDGEASGLTSNLDQISAEMIEKVELISNPNAAYDAEGASGIINVVLKKNNASNRKSTLKLLAGYPQTIGIDAGHQRGTKKYSFLIQTGAIRKSMFQTKEHLRENFENSLASDYYQFDRQDKFANNAYLRTNLSYKLHKNHKLTLWLMGSAKSDVADRTIDYKRIFLGEIDSQSEKEIDIELKNYLLESRLNYSYKISNKSKLTAKFNVSYLDQNQKMFNEYYPEINNEFSEDQRTLLVQENITGGAGLNYNYKPNDVYVFDGGYQFKVKDLINRFSSESYNPNGNFWEDQTELVNDFTYVLNVHALYAKLNTVYKSWKVQVGLRGEYTQNILNDNETASYMDLFPSISVSKKLGKHTSLNASYSRRINRPTIKMLNPYSDEYADLLNMHKGNPDLLPEYVNSVELGAQYSFDKFSITNAIYYRDIRDAISRVKAASNDSALYVSFINLDKARMYGAELSIRLKAFSWWSINGGANVFNTNLEGEYKGNLVNNSRTGWQLNLSNTFKYKKWGSLQISSYYRSKLPSVMGIYKERYYMDVAFSKPLMKKKAKLVFKVSDLFDTYLFGLDLEALDENKNSYSQSNRRKRESRYFLLSFIYNLDAKQSKSKTKRNFFLEEFDK
jgi:outer membrane receptor protein involved in Fe transport